MQQVDLLVGTFSKLKQREQQIGRAQANAPRQTSSKIQGKLLIKLIGDRKAEGTRAPFHVGNLRNDCMISFYLTVTFKLIHAIKIYAAILGNWDDGCSYTGQRRNLPVNCISALHLDQACGVCVSTQHR